MERIKIVIADTDTHFIDLVSRFLKNFPDVEIVACEENGQDALHAIRSLQPDAVLFDLVLPGIDGISLLHSVNALQKRPAMICCTRFYSDVATEAMRTYGASYLMYKPIELQTLHPAIVSCARLHKRMQRLNHAFDDPEIGSLHQSAHIRNYLVSIGIPSKLIGCSYLTEAVRLAKVDVSLARNLSKGVYLEISRSMNTTPTRIERCIRNAISIAFQSGGLDRKMLTCPSNKEFINYVLRTIDL